MSAGKLLRHAVDVVKIAVRFVLVLLVQFIVVKTFIVKGFAVRGSSVSRVGGVRELWGRGRERA
jgi:hypothetical protein